MASTVEPTETESGQLPAPERQRRLTAIEALARHQRLVLLGEPGSGKSTVLNFLGLCLARAQLGEPGWLERLGDAWPHGALLPIRVVLREFAAWLDPQDIPPQRGRIRLIWRWLEEQCDVSAVVIQILQTAVADGQAILLLDGLDEVPDGPGRGTVLRIRGIIAALGEEIGASRLLLTCRVLDYQEPHRQLPGWRVETIVALSHDIRTAFITRWYDVLADLDRPLNGDPADLRERLQSAVSERSELRRLAGNPLLLTMMTLLHAYEGRLPDERVKLYEKCIEFLLLRWRPERGARPLRELLDLPQWSESSDLGRLLDRLGFAAHERGVSGDGDAGADLPRDVLLKTAERFFAAYDTERDMIRAQTFLNYISAFGNGIVQQHSQTIYRFPHRTFQEYLAARRLVSDDDWPDDEAEFIERALRRAAAGPQWREALLLAVSQQAVVGRQIRPTVNLVEELLKRHTQDSAAWTQDAALAGELLVEVGRERLGERYALLWNRTRAVLKQVLSTLDADGAAIAPVAVRVRSGVALGHMGDDRYPVSIADWQREIERLAAGDSGGYFCCVPAGDYIIGSAADDPDARAEEQPQHTIRLDQSLWIARLPITNEQWRVWVTDGGKPSYAAGDGSLNQPNQPVVAITGYMADEFCAWLTKQLRPALPDGYTLRLPTEFEWEAAARGGDVRRYPWGDRWQPDLAAVAEERELHGATTTLPVGCYPVGAAPCGAFDMAGNVWEWTVSNWCSYPGARQAFSDGRWIVLRGGSAQEEITSVRCGSRSWSYPYHNKHNLGFRVFLSLR